MSDDVRRQAGEAPDLSPATLAVRAGEDAARAHRGTQVPIVYSAAFGYEDVDSWVDSALGVTEGHIYSRNTNPTVAAFEKKVRILEGAEAATSFSTGMAAVSNTLFALRRAGGARRLRQGHLRWHQSDVRRLPAAHRRGGGAVRNQRLRSDRGGHRQGLPPRVPGVADQSDAQDPRHRAALGGGPRGRRDRGRRQHVRDADQPEPAGAWHRPGAAQRHQVPRRPRRRARRRALRPRRAHQEGVPLPRDHRRLTRPDGRVPVRAQPQDPCAAGATSRTRTR